MPNALDVKNKLINNKGSAIMITSNTKNRYSLNMQAVIKKGIEALIVERRDMQLRIETALDKSDPEGVLSFNQIQQITKHITELDAQLEEASSEISRAESKGTSL